MNPILTCLIKQATQQAELSMLDRLKLVPALMNQPNPHRFNSALKVAPLGLSVLASRLLVPHLMDKKADVRPKKKDRSKPPASSWGWGAGVLGLGALGALAATTARNQPWSPPPGKSVSASSPGKTVTGKRMTNLQALLTSVGITGAAGLAGNTAVRANLDRIGALSSQSSPFLHTLAGKIRGELPNLAEKGRIRTPDIVVPKASQSAFIHNTATVTSPSGFSYNQPGWALRAPTNLHPSILAHEAGHAQRGLARGMYMNAVPGALGTLLGGAGLFTKDENTSLALSAVPTALQSVRLVDELAASRAGANLVRSFAPVGMSAPAVRQVARGAYGGVPSYALQATLPLATHYLRKYLGGFEQSAAP